MNESESIAARPTLGRRLFWILVIAGLWIAARLVFWVGYAGADDQFYARYAWRFHRPPVNHMEYRMLTVAPIRAAFLMIGPYEVSAALPSMIGSACVLLSVAWFVGWPRTLNWQTNGSMLLATLIPIDVSYATYPGPGAIAAGFLALGTVCLLRGGRALQFVGAVLLALGFMTHILMFYYVAILCFAALGFDWRKYWPPVVACVVISGLMIAGECSVYQKLQGDFFAQFKTFDTQMEGGIVVSDREGSVTEFFLAPVKMLLFQKHFGFDLSVAVFASLLVWRRLTVEQRILWVATFGFWFWLAFGSTVPWAWRPPSRGPHYYTPLVLGACALAPAALGLLFARRRWIGVGILGVMLAWHLVSLAGGGKWGQRVDVSRELLTYANAHPNEVFLADVYTMNELYLLNQFVFPPNVRCLVSDEVAHHLLENKEPDGTPVSQFEQPARYDGILFNHVQDEKGVEDAFAKYFKQHRDKEIYTVPKRYTLLFAPFVSLVGERSFMIRSPGGAVYSIKD